MSRILTGMILFVFCQGLLFAKAPNGIDKGYLIIGPEKEVRTKQIKENEMLTAFYKEGAFVTGTAGSPWHKSTLFAHGSVIRDKEGKALKEVIIIVSSDEDGDQTWGVIWRPDARKDGGEIEIIQGTGKWSGISGKGEITGIFSKRVDGYEMPGYEIEWEIDPENPPFADDVPNKEQYEYMDKCLSFHGPHVYIVAKEFDNGVSLEFNSQSGVLLSQISPDHLSPRNGATCFDTGQTVKKNGKVLGDVMLLEDTDADGDVAWLYHIWWYNKGPGIYDFIGGTGKWEGIEGRGVTKGMFRGRTDDHFMLKSELYWNIEK